jgi:hypothetical protein
VARLIDVDLFGLGVLAPDVMRAHERIGKGTTVSRSIGFWVMWQTYGGFAGLVDSGLMSQRTVYYGESDFKAAFGCAPDEWQPGLAAAVRNGVADE